MRFPYKPNVSWKSMALESLQSVSDILRYSLCFSRLSLTSLEVQWQSCALGCRTGPISVGTWSPSPLERKQRPLSSWHDNTCSLARAWRDGHLNTARRMAWALLSSCCYPCHGRSVCCHGLVMLPQVWWEWRNTEDLTLPRGRRDLCRGHSWQVWRGQRSSGDQIQPRRESKGFYPH